MKVTKIHFDIYNKILFAVLGILLITWFSVFVMEKIKPKKKEAFFGIPNTGNDPITDALAKVPAKVNEAIDYIKDIPGKILEPINSIIRKIDNLFNKGIPNHLACGKSMADSGFNGGLQVLNIQFMCFWDKFIKFFDGQCTLYYMVDAVSKMLTIIFIRLPLTIIKAIFGIDLHFLVDIFKSLILVPINELFIIIVGFGFLEWSDTIVQRCYRCQGKIRDSGGKVVYSDSKSFGDWATLYTCSNSILKSGIDKIFYSAFPSKHWQTWYDGNHLDGGDDGI
jgi:hypothetical protein